jgi:hypothetical protein
MSMPFNLLHAHLRQTVHLPIRFTAEKQPSQDHFNQVSQGRTDSGDERSEGKKLSAEWSRIADALVPNFPNTCNSRNQQIKGLVIIWGNLVLCFLGTVAGLNLPVPLIGPPEMCENQSLAPRMPKRRSSIATKVVSSRSKAGSSTDSACSRHMPQEVSWCFSSTYPRSCRNLQ